VLHFASYTNSRARGAENQGKFALAGRLAVGYQGLQQPGSLTQIAAQLSDGITVTRHTCSGVGQGWHLLFKGLRRVFSLVATHPKKGRFFPVYLSS
jgi:hypothetical protein